MENLNHQHPLLKTGHLFIKPAKFLQYPFRQQLNITLLVFGLLTFIRSILVFYLEKPTTESNDFLFKLTVNPAFVTGSDVLVAFIGLFITAFIYFIVLKYIFRITMDYKKSILLVSFISFPSIIHEIWTTSYKMYTGIQDVYHQGTWLHQIATYANIFVLWEGVLLFLFLKHDLRQTNGKSILLTLLFIIIPIVFHILVI
ncbi:hypothetical protein RCG19_08195 [Neobacillus sp. OS1-2]|uniref:hypothetical protein n=1 Tax=Neobacillus sp. OS1-2 TaxID=3070680 RepID=UPI0027E0D74C|nr:hypothetical protein [Neobacillus sp. OS1-2]WML41617.1 hypothetical protein RCG19_08195 [Neobacillus sp. OS1-2]